ncbi:hypothetical protein [Nonomuraea insulae]|uniref:Uncharacterized protein n=1 Tax=Nonomuraea insulae TaxID=1616787 RepID=A0ABW1D0G5_9ACTN
MPARYPAQPVMHGEVGQGEPEFGVHVGGALQEQAALLRGVSVDEQDAEPEGRQGVIVIGVVEQLETARAEPVAHPVCRGLPVGRATPNGEGGLLLHRLGPA